MTTIGHRPTALDLLRRSTRLAVLALLVFVLRIGMVAACAPSDYSELSGGAGGVDTHEIVAQDDDGGREAPHLSGHCQHCACHHAAAIPVSSVVPVLAERAPAALVPTVVAHEAPLERTLRPPIA